MLNAISLYFADNPLLYRLYKNAGIVFGGRVIGSILGLISIALLTRTLSLESFGLFALVMAYVGLIERLTGFQTWQAMIHYGAKAKEKSDRGTLASLFVFGWSLDVIGGCLGFLIAIAGAIYVPDWFGLDESNALILATIAASKLLFNWTATATGLMRLYNKFLPIAISQNISAFIQLIGVSTLWLLDEKSLLPYVTVAAVSGIIGQMLLFVWAILEARRQKIMAWSLVNLAVLPSQCSGLWRFVLTTNADGIVRVFRDADIFIVNAILGPAAVGLYKIARVLTRALAQFTGPFYQAIYPELTRLFTENKVNVALKLMKQSSLTLGMIVGSLWIAFYIFGPGLLPVIFDEQYIDAYQVSIWCMAAMVAWAFSQPLSPAMLALGRPGVSLIIHIVTTIIYIGLLWGLTTSFGLVGAGLALMIFYIVWSLSMFFAFKLHVNNFTTNT